MQIVPLDPRFRRIDEILSPEDLREIGRMVVDDLEGMLAGLPPTEMQSAQPEIVHRPR
jgi:hypothetical protein